MRFQATKPIRYTGPLRPLKVLADSMSAQSPSAHTFGCAQVRQSGRKLAVAAKPEPFVEVRGIHVYTYADRIIVSNGIYTTYRYRDRLAAAGGTWDGASWTLPAGTDVAAVLDPHGSIAAKVKAVNRPSWTCCSKAKILSHKNKHYSCPEHTMYWEDCTDAAGNPIKILYACSTKGGGCYTGN